MSKVRVIHQETGVVRFVSEAVASSSRLKKAGYKVEDVKKDTPKKESKKESKKSE